MTNTETILKILEAAGVNPRTHEIGASGDIIKRTTTSLIPSTPPKIHFGFGRSKYSSDPNANKNGSRSTQGNGTHNDGN